MSTPERNAVMSVPAELTLRDALAQVFAARYWIGAATLLGAGCGVAVALALPVAYTANTKILPPAQSQQGSGAALLAQLGGIAGLAGSAGALKTPAELYVGLLRTRNVADALITRFDLKTAYGQKLLSGVRKRLTASTNIVIGKDGLISIDVEDRNPARAADLANAYVAELLRLTKTLALTDAAQRRLFFETQLTETKSHLDEAQLAARDALGKSGLQAVEVQGRSVLDASARLRAQITTQEVRIAAAAGRLTPENPEYQSMAAELAALRGELNRFENGAAVAPSSPATGASAIRLLRDVKYYDALYEMLAKQLEAARLDEARQPAVVQVIDVAEVPDMKSRPARGSIAVGATLLAFLAAVAFFVLRAATRAGTGRGRVRASA